MKSFLSAAPKKVLALALLALALTASPVPGQKDPPPLDRTNMDLTVRPGDDFYRYANGRWIQSLVLPEDKSSYDSFAQARDQNRERLRSLFESLAAAAGSTAKGSPAQKVGDFYAAAMDTAKVEALGVSPLQADLARIEALTTVEDMQNLVADLHHTVGPILFGAGVLPDLKNAKAYAFYLGQGGLGMPDRDYYTKEDAASRKLQEEYRRHITAMLKLLGDDPDKAAAEAATIMDIETRLARGSLTNVELRNLPALYNPMTLSQLTARAPGFDWARFLDNIGIQGVGEVIVTAPVFFKEMGRLVTDVPLADWKTYLRWHLLTAYAPSLSSPFVNENFRFFSHVMKGTQKIEERWKRMVSLTSSLLGELVGQMYVETYFPPDSKERMEKLVFYLKQAFANRLQKLSWMSESTRREALAKLEAMKVEVGYPSKWEDYSRLEISPDGLIANIKRVSRFEFEKNLADFGRPVDTTKWDLKPHEVNAGNAILYNKLLFPAGILQPPFFFAEADDAVNYGAIGMGIGHEMSHGFDDQGRNFDQDGNMRDWWIPEDAEKFKQQTRLLVEQYGGFSTADGVRVNGELSLGENIADYAGLIVALDAYHLSLEGKKRPEPVDGFTDDQRFFLAFAQLWRGKIRDEALKRMIQEDVHPWGEFRVNGAPFNVPEFYTIFDIKPGDKLYRPPDKRPVIW
ncbi:MAG: M13 family metallopeptidase [Candidatus Aminicenantes bacterium]|nr:M13 family metallopeptidase [Candidatus Aminicenantes bacterium]